MDMARQYALCDFDTCSGERNKISPQSLYCLYFLKLILGQSVENEQASS